MISRRAALELLLYARAGGRQGAEYEIGTLLAERGDVTEAETYWREAAAAGRLQAQEKLARLYHDRGQDAEAQSYGAQAIAQYRARADGGDTSAMRWLARAYDEGVLTSADPEAYWQWVERAAEAGDVVSQGVLARAYLEGRDRRSTALAVSIGRSLPSLRGTSRPRRISAARSCLARFSQPISGAPRPC